jgi:hypothetical protein
MNDMTIYEKFNDPGQLLEQIGKAICLSEMFGCDNASQGQVLALECAAKRIPPMSLAERYHIIHGRLSMKADAMLADFRSKLGGTHKVIEKSPDRAAIQLILGDQELLSEITWEEARIEPFVYAGKEASVISKIAKGQFSDLVLKPKYATPRSRGQMLWARAVSDGVRTIAPEVIAGYYTPEEISDAAEADDVAYRQVTPTTWTEANSQGEVGPVVDVRPEVDGEPVEEKPKGVKLSGQAEDAHSAWTDDPCGEVVADQIKTLARTLGMPPAKLKEIVESAGCTKLAEMPHNKAAVLLAKLHARATSGGAPF